MANYEKQKNRKTNEFVLNEKHDQEEKKKASP
jgi:hypothetical protein